MTKKRFFYSLFISVLLMSFGFISKSKASSITTYYGSTASANSEGNRGLAQIQSPRDLLEDSSGNLYVLVSNRIAKIDSDFNLTFIAGNASGDQDGVGRNALFKGAQAMAFGPNQDYIYIADTQNHKIKRLELATLRVTTIAGSTSGNSDGAALSAQFNDPEGIAVALDGTIYVSDTDNRRIKTISSDLTTVAYFAGTGSNGLLDGAALSARFREPTRLAFNSTGELHIVDRGSHAIRKIVSGTVSTVLGGTAGDTDGDLASARIRNPQHIFFDSSDQMYICDTENNKLRLLNSSSNVVTLAGLGQSEEGYRDGDESHALLNDPYAAILRADNTLLIADRDNHSLRRVDANSSFTEPSIKTIAGNVSSGEVNGKFGLNRLNGPRGLAYDSAGNLYIADTSNDVIRVLYTNGNLATFAGSGAAGSDDGTADIASFNDPYDLAIDSSDNLYVADYKNRKVRKITAAGVVSTLAGSGSSGSNDAVGTAASFSSFEGLDVDSSGNVYVADTGNRKIRMITPDGTTTTISGSGSSGTSDGPTSIAKFGTPSDVAVNSKGELFVTDRSNHSIRKIVQSGSTWISSTFAGGLGSGSNDGDAAEATFSTPRGISVDSSDNLYIADSSNNKIRKISSEGLVSTVAGNGHLRFRDGNRSEASFKAPYNLSISSAGNLVVTDTSNHRIRSIDASLVTSTDTQGQSNQNVQTSKIITIAGQGTANHRDGAAQLAYFNKPYGLAKDSSGNIYIADRSNHLIRKFDPSTNRVTTVAGRSRSRGSEDGSLGIARFNAPSGIDIDSSGNIYVADYSNHKIRMVATNGSVSTIAGTGTGGFTDGNGSVAQFKNPYDVKIGPDNRLYVSDYNNHRIRVIETNGSVSTFAGSGSGDTNGPSTIAKFKNPVGLSFDSKGDLYFSDLGNGKIKKVSNGNLTTIAGSGTKAFRDGQGQNAHIKQTFFLTHDNNDNLFFADTTNHRIRKITPGGLVSTVAGTGLPSDNDGTVDEAGIYNPRGVIVNAQNEVIFTTENNKLKKVTANAVQNTESSGPILVVPTGNLTPVIAFVSEIEFDENKSFRVVEGTDLALRVFAYDVEDGLEMDDQVTWVSNNQGILTTGLRYNANQLSLGTHNIIVRVIDSSGAQARTNFTLEIVAEGESGADSNGDGVIDDDDGRVVVEQSTAKSIVHIISPKRSTINKRKARLKAVALDLDSSNAVSASNDDQIIWEAIFIDPEAELQEGEVPDRLFLKEGRRVKLGKLEPGLYSIFARHNDTETKINVTVGRNSVTVGSISAESRSGENEITDIFYGLD